MTDPFDAADKVDLALSDLGSSIIALSRALDEADATLERRAEWLSALEPKRFSGDGLYRQLAVVIAGLKRQMAGQIPFGEQVEIDGLGVLTYASSGGSTKWNWSALKPVLAAQIADEVFDRETGEIPPLAVVCERAINAFAEIVSLTPSKKGKTTEIAKRGLDPKEFVTTTDAEPGVRWL